MDQDKLRDQADRGADAEHIKNHPLVKKTFEDMEAQIEKAWKSSGPDDQEIRERAFLMHRLLKNFQQFFIVTIANGEAAHNELLSITKEDE
jgi:hypothetical protein